jgi:hypothetical protein
MASAKSILERMIAAMNRLFRIHYLKRDISRATWLLIWCVH